ncbi:NUDIX domain-containing protein [Desulfonatronospira sp.]|uniref:NUDIX domain-containing protein n=1 Tax=Desulfonatronospira sp. TaxID=1962951 RepID=UPI0025C3FD34|nr:NUDIX domain-containing protein [Desulfonatronospira sp.]
MYLQKRTASEPPYCGRWDLPASGHVMAGEAVQEAASRELRERTGLKLAGFRLVALVDGLQETNYEFMYVFNAGRIRSIPVSSPEKLREGLFMDTRELSLLVQEHPETITPKLIYLWKLELLFS